MRLLLIVLFWTAAIRCRFLLFVSCSAFFWSAALNRAFFARANSPFVLSQALDRKSGVAYRGLEEPLSYSTIAVPSPCGRWEKVAMPNSPKLTHRRLLVCLSLATACTLFLFFYSDLRRRGPFWDKYQ